MSEIKLVSPLLDGLKVLDCFSTHGRSSCYYVEREDSEEQYVLKHISIPESETKIEALILTGAVADRAGAQAYYEGLANDIRREVVKLQSLSGHSAVASWSGYQMEAREDVGFDAYLLMPRRNSLRSYLKDHALTQLQALNFGIDLCNALSTLRDAGYVYLNLKPENVFVDDLGRFMLGDLGLMPVEGLDFCAVPEDYLNDFSAPEMLKLFSEPTQMSDIYSLGLILYYIFNGNHLPFDDGKTKPERARSQRLRGDILPSPAYADYELAEIIIKACSVEPEERWQSPAELRQALTLYMQRNEVSDQLLVPPLPLEEEAPAEEASAEQAPADAAAAEEAPAEEAPAEEAPEEEEEIDLIPEVEGPDLPVKARPAEEPEAEPEEAPMFNLVVPDDEAEEVFEEEPEEAFAEETEEAPEEIPEEEPEEISEEVSEEVLAEIPEEAEEEPEANMTLDELLASVNDVLADQEPKVTEIPDLEANELAQKEQQEPKKKRKKVWVPIVIALAVLAFLGGALAYFYMNWYLVTMNHIAVTNRTDDSITVAYDLSTPDPDLSWDCIDTYGNSFPGMTGEDSVVFKDLTPGMQYTVSFYPGKLHKLLGTTSIAAATAAQTEIVSFDAALAGSSTTAEISMVVSGPEAVEWTVTYSSDGSDSGSVNFSGHTVQIPGLALHQKYTFELQAPDEIYLTGETSCELAVVGDVQAKNLQVVEATEDSLSVTWESIADEPLSWNVSCVGDGYSETVEANVCAATFHGIDLNKAYTFTVSAEGLKVPLSVSLPANATVITSLEAEALDAGTVKVSWACADPQPEKGWKVRYYVSGNEALGGSVDVPEENEILLCGLPANSEVVVVLETANGVGLIGKQTLSTATVEAPKFTDHDFVQDKSELNIYPRPEKDSWGYDDLSDSADTFDGGANVAVVLEASEKFKQDDKDETSICLVLRRENGSVVKYDTVSCTWNDMWSSRRYLTEMLLPEAGGSYQIELYFDNQFVGSKVLTINGTAEETPEG